MFPTLCGSIRQFGRDRGRRRRRRASPLALMEWLSLQREFPLARDPFRHLDRAGDWARRKRCPRSRGRWSAGICSRLVVGLLVLQIAGPQAWVGGAGGRPGHRGDASRPRISSAGRDQSADHRDQQHDLELRCWFRSRPARCCCLAFARLDTTPCGAAAGPSAGGVQFALAHDLTKAGIHFSGSCSTPAAGSASLAQTVRSPSGSSAMRGRAARSSVERWPIETMVVSFSRSCSRP